MPNEPDQRTSEDDLRAALAHAKEFMAFCMGHDRSGLDHLAESQRFAGLAGDLYGALVAVDNQEDGFAWPDWLQRKVRAAMTAWERRA